MFGVESDDEIRMDDADVNQLSSHMDGGIQLTDDETAERIPGLDQLMREAGISME